ncbi:MAG: NUDIX domain-containing protein [Candidatus Diapherotrites archaeon]
MPEKPQASVGIFLKDGKMLTEVRSMENELCPGARTFPSGHFEKGENAEQALEREMKEELGVQVLEKKFLGTFEFSSDYAPVHDLHYFLVTKWKGNISEKGEDATLEWIPVLEYKKLDYPVDATVLKKAGLVH